MKQESKQLVEEKQEKLLQSDFESCYTCGHFMSSSKRECKKCKNFDNWTMSYDLRFSD